MSKPGATRVNYCDSVQLERDWFHWLLARATPDLENLRQKGLLWTRTRNCDGAPSKGDPYYPEREHCVALPTPLYCSSTHGVPGPLWRSVDDSVVTEDRLRGMLSLDSDDPLLRLDLPFLQRGVVIPSLLTAGFHRERPVVECWHQMNRHVRAICTGVAQKFHPPSEEERDELAHEALLQVLRKLRDGKLIYTPGKAPVFNLLTTTIYRCMYTIKSKSSKQRLNTTKLASDLNAGVAPRSFRSLRVPGPPAIRPYHRQ